jgi:translation initiation factor 6 (eIF-6)
LPSLELSLSTILIVSGALIANWVNMEDDYTGIVVVWINNFVQAFVNVMIESKNKERLLSSMDIQIYNQVVSGLFCFGAMFYYTNDPMIIS